jgi:hypothetical protein
MVHFDPVVLNEMGAFALYLVFCYTLATIIESYEANDT